MEEGRRWEEQTGRSEREREDRRKMTDPLDGGDEMFLFLLSFIGFYCFLLLLLFLISRLLLKEEKCSSG